MATAVATPHPFAAATAAGREPFKVRNLAEAEFGSAKRHIPSDSAHCSTCCWSCHLRQLEPEVTFLHDARRCKQTYASRDKDGFQISVAERFELAEPSGKHRRDVIEWQLGMNA